jgi:hypothetical protein
MREQICNYAQHPRSDASVREYRSVSAIRRNVIESMELTWRKFG